MALKWALPDEEGSQDSTGTLNPRILLLLLLGSEALGATEKEDQVGLWGRTFEMGKEPVLLNRDPSWGLHVATRNTFLPVHSLHRVLGGTKAI